MTEKEGTKIIMTEKEGTKIIMTEKEGTEILMTKKHAAQTTTTKKEDTKLDTKQRRNTRQSSDTVKETTQGDARTLVVKNSISSANLCQVHTGDSVLDSEWSKTPPQSTVYSAYTYHLAHWLSMTGLNLTIAS